MPGLRSCFVGPQIRANVENFEGKSLYIAKDGKFLQIQIFGSWWNSI